MSVLSKSVTLRPSGAKGKRVSMDVETATTIMDLARFVSGKAEGTYKSQVRALIRSLRKVGIPELSHASSRFYANGFGSIAAKDIPANTAAVNGGTV